MEKSKPKSRKYSKLNKEDKDEIVRALIKGESSHTEELVDHYWGSINYVLSLIKASEIKAGLILSFYGILLNLIYQNLALVLTDESTDAILISLLSIWILCTIISVYNSIRCFIPKIEGDYDKNIFFFGDIISKFGTIREFSQTFYNISLKEEELFDHLGQQIYIIAKISAFKFKCVNLAIRYLAIGLLVLLSAGIYFVVFKFLLQ
jgi:hypothetical protein